MAANYQGPVVIHCINFTAQHDSIPPGRTVILLSASTGSCRSMQQNFQGMMVVVGKFGEPDKFTMFMCYLNWPEITS